MGYTLVIIFETKYGILCKPHTGNRMLVFDEGQNQSGVKRWHKANEKLMRGIMSGAVHFLET